MHRPVHFEIHAADPEACEAFYKGLFGWQFFRWGDQPYWLINTGDGNPMAGVPSSRPGIDGGMVPREGGAPGDAAPVSAWVVTVDVPDCRQFVERALELGGTLVHPVNPVPGVGWLAYVKDPEGNLFGMMQPDESAPAPSGA